MGRNRKSLAYLVSWKDVECNMMSQKLVYIVVSRWRGKSKKKKRESDKEIIFKRMVAQMSFLSVFCFDIVFVLYDIRQVR